MGEPESGGDPPIESKPLGRTGRFELRRELGRGSMGVVYEAWDPDLGRRIALKTLNLAFPASPEAAHEYRERFMVEARAAARLQHPGIVVVHDLGADTATGAPFIALEFVPGPTLAELIRERGAWPWKEAVRLVRLLAEALAHAHAQGVVHRDIKPANIMMTADGLPKITDFGIAKIDTARLRLTGLGQAIGTPLYMSPEQALGDPADARSDLFSLGSILYTLLSGRLAFAADSVPAIVARVAHATPEPIGELAPDLPMGLAAVVGHAHEKSIERRYQSALEFAEDLGSLERGELPSTALAAAAAFDAAGATRVSATADSPLVALLDASQARAEPSRTAPVATSPRRSPSGPRAGERPLWLSGAAVATALLFGLGWLSWSTQRARPRAVPNPPSPSLAAPSPEARSRAPVVEGPVATPAPAEPVAEGVGPAVLVLDFEHPLKTGVLRVWIDDVPVLEAPLQGRVAKKIAGVRLRKGGLEQRFEMPPGRHTVMVEVAWDDELRRAQITGTFGAGSPRRLAARVGRLIKSLSLEWQ